MRSSLLHYHLKIIDDLEIQPKEKKIKLNNNKNLTI